MEENAPYFGCAGQVGGSVAALCKSRCMLRNFSFNPCFAAWRDFLCSVKLPGLSSLLACGACT